MESNAMKKLLVATILLLSVAVLSNLSVKKNTGEHKERILIFSKEHKKIEKFQVSESDEYIDVTEVFGLINDIKTELKNEQALKSKQELAEYEHRVKEEAKKRKLAEEKRIKKEKEKQEKIRQRELSEKPVLASREQSSSKQPRFIDTYEITAYHAGYESTGKSPGQSGYGLTASGTTVAEGRTIACPPELSFGTVVEIEGVGMRVCEDRGGAIKGKILDLYIADKDRVWQWGRQKRQIKVY